MSDKNVEKSSTGSGTPTPDTSSATATAEKPATVSAPAVSPAEKQDAKITAAFIAQRKEIRELKHKAAQATPATAIPPAATPTADPQPQNTTPSASPAPAQTIAVRDIEAESAKAIEELGQDAEVAKVPGMLMDIIQKVDTDPRLKALHDIDPTLAFREGRNILISKAGMGGPVAVPMSSPTSGGMSTTSDDLEALVAECEKHKPGTKEFNILSSKIRAKIFPIV